MSQLSLEVAKIEEHIKSLMAGIEQSAANHNFLLGSLTTAKTLLAMASSGVETANTVVNDVTPVVEALSPLLAL